jgi:cell division septum initiation protein DivIVA
MPASTSYAADDLLGGRREETQVLSHDHDEDVRSAAGSRHDDDPVGHVVVPGPRSPSAARLLELTARDTDRWRSEAKAEAAEIVAAAREEAQGLVRAAQREADGHVHASRLEAERTLDEAKAAAEEVRVEAARQRMREETEVARLQQVAADHAQHLRQHLNNVLDSLDSAPS